MPLREVNSSEKAEEDVKGICAALSLPPPPHLNLLLSMKDLE